MSKGWRSRSIYLRYLAFALAIQAFTPDAHDLASPLLFKLVALTAGPDNDQVPGTGSIPIGNDSFPSRTDDQDEQPDEVCLPGGHIAKRVLHCCVDGSTRLVFAPFGQSKTLDRERQQQFSDTHCNNSQFTDIILASGHLTC